MNASAFDPNVFLDAQQTEVNEKRPPIPTENPEAAVWTLVLYATTIIRSIWQSRKF